MQADEGGPGLGGMVPTDTNGLGWYFVPRKKHPGPPSGRRLYYIAQASVLVVVCVYPPSAFVYENKHKTNKKNQILCKQKTEGARMLQNPSS